MRSERKHDDRERKEDAQNSAQSLVEVRIVVVRGFSLDSLEMRVMMVCAFSGVSSGTCTRALPLSTRPPPKGVSRM